MKIPLVKILGDHGPYASYGMFDFEYRITLPQSKKILKAQDGEDKGEYKLTDLHLEYEIIESEDLVRKVKDQYDIGRSLGYDYTTLLKTLSLEKRFYEGSNRCEHSSKKYESHRVTFYESRC